MIHKHQGDIQWLEFELLADVPIIHGCMMKHGGVSSGHLESLNLGKSVGDELKNVETNFKRVSQALCFTDMISAKLCHGATVSQITSKKMNEIPVSDGLTTSLENLAICVTQADCQAAIFYDPVRHAIANVHCGWRGSVQNIYAETIKSMKVMFGSKAADLLVCVSPSLGPEFSEFIHYQDELPKNFLDFRVKGNDFDFWRISEWQLLQSGVLPHHIQIACVDTYSSSDYFSYRRSKSCGRQATICALKPKWRPKSPMSTTELDKVQACSCVI